MRNTAFFVAVLFLAILAADSSLAKAPPDPGTFALTWENDAFCRNDRYYTNGIQIHWISPDLTRRDNATFVPDWVRSLVAHLPPSSKASARRAVSISLGQSIFTPDDLERTDLIHEDRPYAGLAYLTAGFHSRRQHVEDGMALTLGIVGEHSYARAAQEVAHEYIDGNEPKGWRHQLKDELVLELTGRRRMELARLNTPAGTTGDLIWLLEGGIGNLALFADTGLIVRGGWNLPRDFGHHPIRYGFDSQGAMADAAPRPAEKDRGGVHVFAGLVGSYVARNIFLDGNTFRESHRVNRKPWVGDALIGFGMHYGRWKLTYTHIFRSEEFDTQDNREVYGSLSVSFAF